MEDEGISFRESEGLTEEDERFTINTDAKVDWVLAQFSNLENEADVVEKNAADILERINKARKSLEDAFSGQIKDYLERKWLEKPKGPKTFRFLHGTASLTSVPEKITVDKEEAGKYVTENDIPGVLLENVVTFSRRTIVFNMDEYIRLADPKIEPNAEGEAVTTVLPLPGIAVVPAHQRLNLKPGTPNGTKETGS